MRLKPASSYRPSRAESALAWVFTASSAFVVAWFVLVPFLGRG
ncbi:MAG: hypothetical protein QF819_07130 [Gemmatimonadota bacterium]|nr:hypothetical protein [Gemmatimonadota bacterium]MDP6802932.1 hypothetical protein [Gemmatimonadota bacterium]MDP7032753.1 hypothetical protein [Gemmatimonadota bacterium]